MSQEPSPATLGVNALENAYLALLKMPHGGLRLKHQSTLCLLRDAIAEEAGLDTQFVQEKYEEMALRSALSERGTLTDEQVLAIAKDLNETDRGLIDQGAALHFYKAICARSAIRESADTARMDWLETQDMIGIHHEGYGDYTYYAGGAFEPLREAVDAAMKKEAK